MGRVVPVPKTERLEYTVELCISICAFDHISKSGFGFRMVVYRDRKIRRIDAEKGMQKEELMYRVEIIMRTNPVRRRYERVD